MIPTLIAAASAALTMANTAPVDPRLYVDQRGVISQCDGAPGTDLAFAGSACDVLLGQSFKPVGG